MGKVNIAGETFLPLDTNIVDFIPLLEWEDAFKESRAASEQLLNDPYIHPYTQQKHLKNLTTIRIDSITYYHKPHCMPLSPN